MPKVKTIDSLSDLVNLINEQAQRGNAAAVPRRASSSAEEMAFLMRMMQNTANAKSMALQPASGLNHAGGKTDRAGNPVTGNATGKSAAARNVDKASGVIENSPAEFRDALDNYFHGIEQNQGLKRSGCFPIGIVAGASPCALRAQQLYTGSASLVAEEVDRMYVKGMQFLARTQARTAPGPTNRAATNRPSTAWPWSAFWPMAMIRISAPTARPFIAGWIFILKDMDPKTGYIGNFHVQPRLRHAGPGRVLRRRGRSRALAPALQKAVRLIVNAQKQNAVHAWRYSPESQDADTTVSGAQMVALVAARNAGMAVPEEAIQNGLKFFLSCQTPEGGFGYISPIAPNATRTAIGCVVFALAKEKNSAAFKNAFNFFKDAQPDRAYPQYFLYYASQAYFHGSPELWQGWNRANIKMLRSTQTPDGNWEGQLGSTFATSGSLLSLALNYRYLPIYER